MVSPRLLTLAQPKRSCDLSMNDPVKNSLSRPAKPLWRSTRQLSGPNGLPTVYPRSRNYHEERFGWNSGYWIMWDTHPAGTKNALRLAPDDVKKRAAFTPMRPRKHDDPCRMQLVTYCSVGCVVFPTSHTSSARLASAHEAWDSRASAAWQDQISRFNAGLISNSQNSRPSTTTPRTQRLSNLASPRSVRPTPPPRTAAGGGSRSGRTIHTRAWQPAKAPKADRMNTQFSIAGPYVPNAVH